MYCAKNPILPGFRPDPSICRVLEDYYIVNSSFAYFPGIPIYHSRDLAHWEQIGNVLTKKSQLPLEGCGHSEGIFAPVIRYHAGTFYIITTNINKGNFIVTAEHPQGPWSEPYDLGDAAQGIDPDLFFDEDENGACRCYYVGTRPNQQGVRYHGDWEIWIQELDLATMSLTGESRKIWKGAMHNVKWPEGPHIYKKDGYYYLMHAEGGTGQNHSVAVARSRNLTGPYEGNPNNPVLTHRHLGGSYPVTAVGHGDLVEDGHGNWYMVVLASRRCEGYTNTGRDTWLAKVTWEDGWPVVNAGIGMLEETVTLPGEMADILPETHLYHFFVKELPAAFMMLRNPDQNAVSLLAREGYLRLYALPQSLMECDSPAYVCIRQQEYYYQAETEMEFESGAEGMEAGIAIVCDDQSQVRFSKKYLEGKPFLLIFHCQNGVENEVFRKEITSGRVGFRIVNRGQKADFYYRIAKRGWNKAVSDADMRSLSTEVSGGFTGCTIGMYASSNGGRVFGYADFALFAWEPIPDCKDMSRERCNR